MAKVIFMSTIFLAMHADNNSIQIKQKTFGDRIKSFLRTKKGKTVCGASCMAALYGIYKLCLLLSPVHTNPEKIDNRADQKPYSITDDKDDQESLKKDKKSLMDYLRANYPQLQWDAIQFIDFKSLPLFVRIKGNPRDQEGALFQAVQQWAKSISYTKKIHVASVDLTSEEIRTNHLEMEITKLVALENFGISFGLSVVEENNNMKVKVLFDDENIEINKEKLSNLLLQWMRAQENIKTIDLLCEKKMKNEKIIILEARLLK